MLYAISLSIVAFPKYTLVGHLIFAGGLFVISLIPDHYREEMPKKVSLLLSGLLLVIVTVFTAKATYEQTNVPIVLTAYVVLVSIIAWDIRKDLKPKPKTNGI